MPNIWTRGRSTFVAYITGPTHNLLGLEFGDGQLAVEALPARGGCEHGAIDEDLLRKAVADGLRDAESQTGVSLRACRITYVANDSPQYGIYRHCAKLIACQVGGGGNTDPSVAG